MPKPLEKPKHAKYSASGSKRWLTCPGSVQLAATLQSREESSAYAEEGTRAHECLEMFLKNGKKKQDATGRMLLKKFPAEMISYALHSAEEIWSRVPDGALLLAETRVDLSFVAPAMFGTADAVIVDEFGKLSVIDFKYGAGIVVDAYKNSQLAYYALGVSRKFHHAFTEVELVVLQPRADRGDGTWISSYTMPMSELLGWEDTFREGVRLCESENPPLNPEPEACRFCPAQLICPKLSTEALEQARIDFSSDLTEVHTPRAVTDLDPQSVGVMMDAFERIEAWIDAVRSHALDQLKRGHRIPGWKLVGKRATRRWIDEMVEKRARAEFGSRAFEEPSLLSPAQFEKEFKKDETAAEFLKANTTAVSSGQTLARDADRRPALDLIAEDFTVLED